MSNLVMLGFTNRRSFDDQIAIHREREAFHARSADDLEDMRDIHFPQQESVDTATDTGHPAPQGA